jgi:hypothetical protein
MEMNKDLKYIVNHVVDGIIRGAFDYQDLDWCIEDKLVCVIPKFLRDENNKQIENKEFIETRELIHNAVNENWKVKKHNENIDTIRNLRLGTKEYYDFYANFYQ